MIKTLLLLNFILISFNVTAMLPEPRRSLSEIKYMLIKNEDKIENALGSSGAIVKIVRNKEGYQVGAKNCLLQIYVTYTEGTPPNPVFTVGKCK